MNISMGDRLSSASSLYRAVTQRLSIVVVVIAVVRHACLSTVDCEELMKAVQRTIPAGTLSVVITVFLM